MPSPTRALLATALLLACNPSPAPPRQEATPPSPPSAVASAPTEIAPYDPPEARALRDRLVAEVQRHLPWSGASWDERVLEAMRKTPRHLFVPEASLPIAYQNRPQPIGHGQTISQPTVVAIMTNALELRGPERVLEIGTGSGYQAAVLSRLAKQVYTIEIVAPLGEMAKTRLKQLGYANVEVRIGDGYAGWPEHAPFDRILITAAPPEIPKALVEQLAEGGILVAPVGEEWEPQELVRWRKRGGKIEKETLAIVKFVPMVKGSGAP